MKYFCYDTALNGEFTLIKLMQQFPKYSSIFSGTEDEKIWDAAPWLFELNDNPYKLKGQPLIQMGHCIVFETGDSLKNLLDFLHSKIYTKENGKDRFFRIWDARVLIKHLPLWNRQDLADFFTVFMACYTESETEGYLDKWQLDESGRLTTLKVQKELALPHIKTEEELDKEFEATHQRTEKYEEVAIKNDEKPMPEIEKKEEETPRRRKFFMD